MRIVDQRLEACHRPVRHLDPVEQLDPFRGGPRAHDRREKLIEFGAILGPRSDAGKARILRQLGPPAVLEKIVPMAIGIGQRTDIAVGGRKGGVRASSSGDRPPAPGRLEAAAVEMLDRDIADHRLEHRHLDITALAGAIALASALPISRSHRPAPRSCRRRQWAGNPAPPAACRRDRRAAEPLDDVVIGGASP